MESLSVKYSTIKGIHTFPKSTGRGIIGKDGENPYIPLIPIKNEDIINQPKTLKTKPMQTYINYIYLIKP